MDRKSQNKQKSLLACTAVGQFSNKAKTDEIE